MQHMQAVTSCARGADWCVCMGKQEAHASVRVRACDGPIEKVGGVLQMKYT
jgi:hypothetical protein